MNRQTGLAAVSKLVVELTGALSAREHQLAAAEDELMSLRATLAEREKELARAREALTEARDAWQQQLEYDIDGCCPRLEGDTPGIYDGAIEETRALIARLNAVISQESSLGCGCVDACRQGFNFAMCHLRAENRHRPETIPRETR